MEDYEHVTSLKYVSLKSEETVSGFKGYVAIGTNYSLGEEILSRGRVSRHRLSSLSLLCPAGVALR